VKKLLLMLFVATISVSVIVGCGGGGGGGGNTTASDATGGNTGGDTTGGDVGGGDVDGGDVDGDGYTENQGDCNDGDSSIYPGATEICGDDIDQDCNGSDLICYFSLISDYMEIKHDQEFLSFEEDEKAIDADLASRGLWASGAHAKKYIENVKKHIDSFVNDSIGQVAYVSSLGTIDSVEISALFDQHQNIDTSYYTNDTNEHVGHFAPDLIGYALDEIIPYINDAYALAKLQMGIN